ncbi:MAG TPA: peptidoglycan editing factor PgeF, partial [Thermomicrobiales bacterium]|nr:peptidoglycan editing factor PgeF [Thermomicrobiales bacterium]
HGLTHRVPGMGKAHGNIGYSGDRDREDAWEMRGLWAEAIGFDIERMVNVGQVHGNEVIRAYADDAGRGARPDSPVIGRADSLITDAPGIVLSTMGADCLPILLVDPKRPAIAAVHAGWRGTVANVAGNTVRAMQREFGTDPAELIAYLGPAIGVCCNEVGDEVIDAWREQAHDIGPLVELAMIRPRVKQHFDVPRANSLLLQRAGLRPEHMEISQICTKCSTDSWFSHRGHGPTAGRQAAFIGIDAVGSKA